MKRKTPIPAVGDTKNWLTVESVEVSRGKQPVMVCRCKCGVTGVRVQEQEFKSGRAKSCGCYKERRGLGQSKTAEYRAWAAMWDRCTNSTRKDYDRYGGRGVTVCERWKDFSAFLKDMGKKPSPQHSIDRVKNELGYEPGNCRWATKKTQANNRSSNRIIECRGEAKTMTEWAEQRGISFGALKQRLKRGWPTEKALGFSD